MRRLRRGLRDLITAVPLAAVVNHYMPLFCCIPWHAVVHEGEKFLLACVLGACLVTGFVTLFFLALSLLLFGGD